MVIGSSCHIGGEDKITVIGQGVKVKNNTIIEQGDSIEPDSVCVLNQCVMDSEVHV